MVPAVVVPLVGAQVGPALVVAVQPVTLVVDVGARGRAVRLGI